MTETKFSSLIKVSDVRVWSLQGLIRQPRHSALNSVQTDLCRSNAPQQNNNHYAFCTSTRVNNTRVGHTVPILLFDTRSGPRFTITQLSLKESGPSVNTIEWLSEPVCKRLHKSYNIAGNFSLAHLMWQIISKSKPDLCSPAWKQGDVFWWFYLVLSFPCMLDGQCIIVVWHLPAS